MLSKKEIYVSFDIETDGPIPGVNSMISLGAVAFNYLGKELGCWYEKIDSIGEQDPDTMEWWKGFPDAWREANDYTIDPESAMKSFEAWLLDLPGKPVLMANPGAWDGMFVTWYSVKFLGRFLPSKHRILDMRSFTMALFGGGFMDSGHAEMKAILRETQASNPMPHMALYDAREQGQVFFKCIALAQADDAKSEAQAPHQTKREGSNE